MRTIGTRTLAVAAAMAVALGVGVFVFEPSTPGSGVPQVVLERPEEFRSVPQPVLNGHGGDPLQARVPAVSGEPGPVTAPLGVRLSVRDASTQGPITGAAVTAMGELSGASVVLAAGTTDDLGECVLPLVNRERGILAIATAPSYATGAIHIDGGAGSDADRAHVINLTVGASIWGRVVTVTDPLSPPSAAERIRVLATPAGSAIPSAVASGLYDPRTLIGSCGSDGRFQIDGVQADTSYDLIAGGGVWVSEVVFGVSSSDDDVVVPVLPVYGAYLRVVGREGRTLAPSMVADNGRSPESFSPWVAASMIAPGHPLRHLITRAPEHGDSESDRLLLFAVMTSDPPDEFRVTARLNYVGHQEAIVQFLLRPISESVPVLVVPLEPLPHRTTLHLHVPIPDYVEGHAKPNDLFGTLRLSDAQGGLVHALLRFGDLPDIRLDDVPDALENVMFLPAGWSSASIEGLPTSSVHVTSREGGHAQIGVEKLGSLHVRLLGGDLSHATVPYLRVVVSGSDDTSAILLIRSIEATEVFIHGLPPAFYSVHIESESGDEQRWGPKKINVGAARVAELEFGGGS